MNRNILLAAAALLILGLLPNAAMAQADSNAPAPDQAALDKDFARKMTHSRLTGFYVIEGHQGPPQQDQYELTNVRKSEDGKWLFVAHLEYGKKSINLPLEIPVLWAGDTPVISITDFTIPGLGTYTARVMIHGNHYAGIWSAGPHHNGYLWGRIEHAPATAMEPSNEPSKKQ